VRTELGAGEDASPEVTCGAAHFLNPETA